MFHVVVCLLYTSLVFLVSSLTYSQSPSYVFRDSVNNERIPSFSNPIGVIDVLDEVSVEFDFVLNAFLPDTTYSNILHIGNEDDFRMPGVWIQESTKTAFICVNGGFESKFKSLDK